jgi:hypothetical protein
MNCTLKSIRQRELDSCWNNKENELIIPERSFIFGLEMINHVFDTVIREVENEKNKIMDNFRTMIEAHCQKKFSQKAQKLHKELDKCTSYLLNTTKALDQTFKDKKLVEVCNEFPNINYLNKTMKKFEGNIFKAEKYAVFWENDYQFVFQKNDFSKSLKDIIDKNVHFNLTTDSKDPKYQDLGKIDDSSIVFVSGNSPTDLNIIHYNMGKMSRAEKQFFVPQDDHFFPISGFRSIWDTSKNLVYLFGGKTDGNYTTKSTYQLKQITKEEDGKKIEIKQLKNMKSSRAYFGSCFLKIKGKKYFIAVGGQQTQKAARPEFFQEKSDTVSMSSSGFEVDVPRLCITDCEIYDISADKWTPLPELCTKRSNTSLCTIPGTTIVYSFGGWNGKNSVNAIERLDVREFIEGDDSFDNSTESQVGES